MRVSADLASDVFGRLRTSSGIFGNDRVVFKNPSTLRIKVSRLYLRKSWQVYYIASKISRAVGILRRKKDGDWYIYPEFLAHENFNNVHKKVQKGYKIFKATIHSVPSTGTNIVKNWLSLCLIRCVIFW